MKTVKDWAQFLWSWYGLRTWYYFFPPKNDAPPPPPSD